MPKPDDSQLAAQLEQLERRLHQPVIRADAAQTSALLAEAFREFGASGRVWSREAMLEALAGEPAGSAGVEAADFHLTRLAPDVALLTYTAIRDGRRTLRSSLWVLRSSGWQILFHQGTPAG